MSEMRIALVAEGVTDHVVIEAALKAILPQPFVLTQLQPEPNLPKMGQGWGGVLRWCRDAGTRHTGSLDADPTLSLFDMLILHVDADVTECHYDVHGEAIASQATPLGWKSLPCSKPCPPPRDNCDELAVAVATWLGQAQLGPKSVLCIPSKSSGTWLACAVLPQDHALLNSPECNLALESTLERLPLKPPPGRIKKSRREYLVHQQSLTDSWSRVTGMCSQAMAFEKQVRDFLQTTAEMPMAQAAQGATL